MSIPLIEATDLAFSYRGSITPAIAGVSLCVGRGEFVLITGPSGCGKSTLCRCLNGLIPHSADGSFKGNVAVKGLNTREHDVSDLATTVGMVFQDPENQLLANEVEMEIAFGPENLGLESTEIEARVTWALTVAGIGHLRNRLVDELSGGEKQRVAVAAAMAMKPEILVLDEPTSEIDPAGAMALIDTLRELNEREGLAIVLTEHRIERLLGAASRLVVMDAGRIVCDGPPEEAFRHDLASLGVFVPPLVQFCHQFGYPYARRISELNMTGGWSADLRTRQFTRGDRVASLANLHYRYPGSASDALKGVSLDVYAGEMVAIMGANGSGKTTLVKHFNGLLRPQGGHVLLYGENIETRTVAENARHAGFVCQNVSHQLFGETVLDEVMFGPLNMGFSRGEAARLARDTAASLGLDERFLDSSPLALSGGEKQRVAIASALAPGPDLIIMDEPTLGLNHGLKEKLAAVLAGIKAAGKAVVLVTHDVEFAALHADRVVLMAGGTILADGSARDVLTSDLLEAAAMHPPQATEIGRLLGISGVLAIEELVRGEQ